MPTRLRPVNDRVIILPIEAAKQTPGGLLLPDVARPQNTRGIVLAVGPGKMLPDGVFWPSEAKVGDTVHYNVYAGSDVEVDGRTLNVLREDEILFIEEVVKE